MCTNLAILGASHLSHYPIGTPPRTPTCHHLTFTQLSAPRRGDRLVLAESQDLLNGDPLRLMGSIVIFRDIWWVYDGYMMGIWWVYDRYMMEIWWKYDGYMMGIWWKYDGNMMEIWWKYDGNMMEIWWKYDGNLTHDGSMVLVFFCANMTGVYWWDPWHTIYSSTMDPSWVMEIDGMNVDPHSQFFWILAAKLGMVRVCSGMILHNAPHLLGLLGSRILVVRWCQMGPLSIPQILLLWAINNFQPYP